MAETDLLPCPFCGDTMEGFAGCVPGAFASGGGKFSVECDCGALGGFASSMAEAVAVWNRRAALSGTREAGEPVAMTDDQIIELAVCHSNYKESAEHEVFSHRRLIEFARALLAAAPPAEVERGVVTDETVRLACPQCDFGIGLHEPGCGQLPVALASPAPAPQPAVEAQGMERFRFNEGDWNNINEMVPASDGEWVRYDALASEKARADRAERERDEARRYISNLLARIHRDGGHHEAQVGTAQAVEDADSVVSHLFVAQDELQAAEAELAKLQGAIIEATDEQNLADCYAKTILLASLKEVRP